MLLKKTEEERHQISVCTLEMQSSIRCKYMWSSTKMHLMSGVKGVFVLLKLWVVPPLGGQRATAGVSGEI